MKYDIEETDYDIDLIELISSSSNTTNQYLVFEGSNEELYAINVSKVIEVLVFKKLDMVRNGNTAKNNILATAKIRDEIATIINFDQWFGNEILEEEEYEYVILAGFGGYNLGIMIKDVEYIISIDFEHMKDNSLNNNKTNFIADIKLNGEDRLCTIFDGDKLLLDIFEDVGHKSSITELSVDEKINSKKRVLFADDSRFIRKMVSSLFENLGLHYEVFENGQELLNRLEHIGPEEIGLIITDLEMPVMDGFSLLNNINSLPLYKDINKIVHTNMSNFIIESSLIDLGACEIIKKIDMLELSIGIKKYFKS